MIYQTKATDNLIIKEDNLGWSETKSVSLLIDATGYSTPKLIGIFGTGLSLAGIQRLWI